MGMILGLSFGTVKNHLDVSRLKLNCATLAQATALAVAQGIFTLDELLSPFPDRTSTPEPPRSLPSGRRPQTE
jgi:hypothetical protein